MSPLLAAKEAAEVRRWGNRQPTNDGCLGFWQSAG